MTTQNIQAGVTDAELRIKIGAVAHVQEAVSGMLIDEIMSDITQSRQASAQSDAPPESEELQKVKTQLAQAEQEITAYDMTMNRQSKLIAELQAQLEAVGAGGVGALISNAERKGAATLEPFGYFKAEPFGWTDCAETDEGAIALYDAPQPQQIAEPAQVTLEMIADILGTGSEARKNHATLIRCIENAIRRSDCLSRIERGFFMAPTDADEDEDEEPGEECLLNWGQSPDDYEKQFGKALDAIIAARGTAQVQAMLSQGLAPGWQAVPVEPTKEMVVAGVEDLRLRGYQHALIVGALEVWRAMLAAAPAAPMSATAHPAEGVPAQDFDTAWRSHVAPMDKKHDTSNNNNFFAAGFRAALAATPAQPACDVPPFGWRCTRMRGHEGPCAAAESPEDKAFVERGMRRIRDAEDAQRYRLLRRGQKWSVIDGIGDTLRGDVLDAAIDAAPHPQQIAEPASDDALMAREMLESQDDSLLICASDLQHSAIHDNHIEMQSCMRAVAERITALAAAVQLAPGGEAAHGITSKAEGAQS